VSAKPQSLSEVRGDAAALLPIAYHLGNRHLPLEIETSSLRYERDHVIDDMVRQLGLVPSQIEAPFEPIDGAYKHHHHEP
jgi:urease accessory protein